MAAIPSSPAGARRTPAAPAVAFVAALAAVLLAANLFLAKFRYLGLPLPDYATWSGVMEVEIKLRLLEDFAREGPVDALLVSSSLGDYGTSAETLTKELSARNGRAFRVFNFGIGGSDLPSYPALYRLARIVAKPKEVWVVAPVSRVRVDNENSLDKQLLEGPFSRYEKVPGLPWLSHAFHELPLVRFAPAVRDALIHLDFRNRPQGGHDAYLINANGDTVSWLHKIDQYALAPGWVANRRAEILGFTQPGDPARAKYDALYFSPRAMAGIRELREELKRDGVGLKVVAIDYSTMMQARDPAFVAAENRYFERLAREYDAPLVNAMPDFRPDAYMINDLIHLNAIGAQEFSRAIAARVAKSEPEAVQRYAASRKIMTNAADPTWTLLTALVPRRADDPKATLELTYLQNWSVRPLRPYADLRLGVRLPDDRDFIVPARLAGPGRVDADTSALPLEAVDQVLRVQLLTGYGEARNPAPVPMAGFRWSSETHAASYYARQEKAKVRSAASVYRLDEPVRAMWQDVEEPARQDWIGIFPVGGDIKQRIDFRFTRGGSHGELELPAVRKPGRYELRFFHDNRFDVVTASEPFEVR